MHPPPKAQLIPPPLPKPLNTFPAEMEAWKDSTGVSVSLYALLLSSLAFILPLQPFRASAVALASVCSGVIR
jgi:hypothetical protein